MKRLFLIIFLAAILNQVMAQDTLTSTLVDGFRIDKDYSTPVLNYLIRKGEITKEEIEEERLNVFNYIYMVDIIDHKKLNDIGIYRFGLIQSHGEVYLLLKDENGIEIISDLSPEKINMKVKTFLSENADRLGEKDIEKYKQAIEEFLQN